MVNSEQAVKRPTVIMLCTFARGGMRSVVEGYRDDGLFEAHDVRLIETHREGSVLVRLAVATRALWQLLGALLVTPRPRCVHLHVAMYGSFWRKHVYAVVAKLAGVPVLTHLHGSEFEKFHSSSGAMGRRLIALLLELSDCVLVLSDSWAQVVRRIAPKAHVRVLRNYVRVPAPAAPRKEGEAVVVLFLGQIGHRKGVYDLIEAARLLKQRGVAFQLLLGGNGELDKAAALIRAADVGDRVELLGWVAGDDKRRALEQADIYVLPSYNEGLPMSLLEAMARGVPVVSTVVGGIPELIEDGVTGRLVMPGDVERLAQALQGLIEDPEARRTAGARARDTVTERYSDTVVLPQLRAVYQEFAR